MEPSLYNGREPSPVISVACLCVQVLAKQTPASTKEEDTTFLGNKVEGRSREDSISKIVLIDLGDSAGVFIHNARKRVHSLCVTV